jgi:sarcosine oxidase subunit gamma
MADLSAARQGPPLTETLWLRSLPSACRWVLRGEEPVRIAAAEALGVALPATACRAGVSGERAALWLGPDEWLLIAPQTQSGLAQRIERTLAGLPHSLVDVSHRQVALLLEGPEAATLLASGCALDLEVAAFPVRMCTRTMLAKAEVLLWRTARDSFRLEVWRSFAPYVTQFLGEAARGII